MTVTWVSEEYYFRLKPTTESSSVFLTSKDKVPQFHFPQEEKGHLFIKSIKTWIFNKAQSVTHCRFFPLTLLVEPQAVLWWPQALILELSLIFHLSYLKADHFKQTTKQRGKYWSEDLGMNISIILVLLLEAFLTILSGSGFQQERTAGGRTRGKPATTLSPFLTVLRLLPLSIFFLNLQRA